MVDVNVTYLVAGALAVAVLTAVALGVSAWWLRPDRKVKPR